MYMGLRHTDTTRAVDTCSMLVTLDRPLGQVHNDYSLTHINE